MVKQDEMEKFWHKLSLAYVTEASDDPDNPNGIVEHKLQWRSQSRFIVLCDDHTYILLISTELSDFMEVLDDRLAKSQQRQLAVGMVAKKVRKEGTPSDSPPPSDAPSWAVKDHAWSASMWHNITCTVI